MTISATLARADLVSVWRDRNTSSHLEYVHPREVRSHRRPYTIVHRTRLSDPMMFTMKRAIDVVGATCALVFLAPLLISVAAAIKLTSPGPVLFSQYRYGHRNKRFRIYKFRTMHTHLGDRSGTAQTTRHDPRVTRIGRLLRNTSLDELPQLLNVVKGDMSLVGPRPHVPGMLASGFLYEELVPYYFQRHHLRPGITGLAQVNGLRGETTQAGTAIARIDYDLEYIENWSPWMDVKIILKTCKREFLRGSGI
jgi:exopolysaccharide biosynthesis polyprenyl glycosylphosphotransferase